MSRRQRDLVAFGVVTLVALSIFAVPLIQGEVFTFRDHTDYFQPLRWFTAQHLRAGALPLWNPYSASGEPWLANPQTGVFYPPTWLFLLLPFASAYVGWLLVHLLILGMGAYRLFALRERQATEPSAAFPGAALFGAVALMLSGPVLSLLDVQNNLATFAWVPWVLESALRDRADPGRSSRRAALLLALAFLAGEPFFAATAALMYAAVVRRPRAIAGAAAGALALSAVQLFPFLEMLRGSDRSSHTLTSADVLRESMPLGDWLRLAVPFHDSSAYDSHLGQHFVPIVYVGLFVAVLAVLAPITAFRSRQREGRVEVVAWLLLLLAAVMVAAGPSLILSLPLTPFRYPSRVVPFGALALVALAVFGYRHVRRNRVWLDVLLIAAVAVDLRLAAGPLLRSAVLRIDRVPYDRRIGRDGKLIRLEMAGAALRRDAWISGYLNLYTRRFDSWTAAPVLSQRYTALYAQALQKIEVSRKLGISYVLTTRPLAGAFVPLASSSGVTIYRDRAAMPMAYVRAPDGVVTGVGALAVEASLARIVTDAPRGGLVVLTQNDAPGWGVEVDGQPRPKLLAEGVLRAVMVAPGRHEIVWRYRPRPLPAGGMFTLGGLVWLALGARRRQW
ncbi:MAG: hypothetical protein JWO56_1465 [Acidobacteria bacterium]|nr:hypothetical protein [Acidobacteriota bacterium]